MIFPSTLAYLFFNRGIALIGPNRAAPFFHLVPVFGSAMGAAALVFWHNYARQVDGSELFPLILDRALFIASAVLATVTGVAAAITPALRAANLDPVVAIRG